MSTKRQTLLAGLAVALLFFALPAFSQGMYQVRDLAWNLSAQADRAFSNIENFGGSFGNQNPESNQLYRSVRRFANDAKQFAQTTDNATDPDSLRPQADRLVREATRIDNLMSQSNVPDRFQREWSNIDGTVQNLAGSFNIAYAPGRQLPRGEYGEEGGYGYNRGYNGEYNGGYGYGNGGYMRWSGTVDGSDLIKIHGDRVWIEHLAANPIQNAHFELPNPLPAANVNLQLRQMQGRGRVQIVEQPSPRNNYTATVRIDDPQSGPDFYSFELTW